MTLAEFLAGWIIRSSTLIAGGALLLWLSRARDSSVRAVVWAAVLFGSFAIPVLNLASPKTFLPALRKTAAGVVVRTEEVPIAVSESAPAGVRSVRPAHAISESAAPTASYPQPASARGHFDWTHTALVFYGALCGGLLLRLCAGLWYGYLLIRRSRTTCQISEGIEILESKEIAAPLTIGILRPVIVFPTDWRQWESGRLVAVLAHERSHIRRHDPLLQLVSGIHRALLWCTPLSWFLHARIIETAEEASDDASVGAIRDGVSYAETLLYFMQRGVWNSGIVGVSMVRPGNPAKRIRRVLNPTLISRGVTSRRIAVIVAMVSPLAYVIATAQARPQFEIADVHVSAASARANPTMQGGGIRAGMYQIQTATMLDLIRTAYNVDAYKIIGGPSWLELDRYDVFAKAPATTSADTAQLMLQALLADRFKLRLHTDSRPLPGFALTLGKGVAPKLKKAEGLGSTGCKMSLLYTEAELAARRQALIQAGNTKPVLLQTYLFKCQNVTMREFAEELRRMPNGQTRLDNLTDRTGLSGEWDFNFKYSSPPPPAAADSEIDGENITVFDAIEKQLGLKLEAARIPTPVIVVDSVNRQPAENPPDVKTILPPPPPAAFEVADLRLSAPGAPEVRSAGPQPGGRFEVRNFPLSFLIKIAWGLSSNVALTGTPAWLNSVRVDLSAKLPSTDATRAVNGVVDMDEFVPALRALLMERFKISIHTEQRPVRGYALVAAKPKIGKADPSLRTKCFEGPGADGKDPRTANPLLSRLITCQNITMDEFVKQLPALSGAYLRNQVVVDSSGIQGAYDFTVSFSAATAGLGGLADVSVPDGGITLFDALDKQLGLKLEKRNIPAPVAILDHIEQKPAEN